MKSPAMAFYIGLSFTGIGIVAVAPLIGCQSGATAQSQLQTIAGLATAGIDAVAASVLATPGLTPDTASEIIAARTTVDSANAVIQGATATTGTNAQQIVAAIRMAAPLLLVSLKPGSAEAIAVNAAVALLPTILAAAGVPPTAAAAPKGVTMTPTQATAYLHGFTGK